MSKKTNLGLIAFCKSKLGTDYVYGAKGEILTQDKYNWLKNTYGSYVRSDDSKKIGKWCVDCSGLISWYTGVKRGSTQYHDLNNPQPLSTIANAPVGSAVWQSGHIGVYIGNGMCIEAKGSAYGTVTSKLSDCKFTHWFTLSDIEYLVDEEIKESNTVQTSSSVNSNIINPIERLEEVAKEVISGRWGNGPERISNLENAGYNYDIVRQAVNNIMKK